jgi:branched-chain amino acid transport system substrate-binding protein
MIPLLATTIVMIPLLAPISAADLAPINIGVIGPYYLPQWGGGLNGHGGMIDGAILAAKEINATGGINGQMINIIPANEHAYEISGPHAGSYDAAAAVTSVDTLLQAGAQFIIGGFRTETTTAITEEVMDYNTGNTPVPFFVCGSTIPFSTWTDQTSENYTRYKWMFRSTPVNGTMLFMELVGYLQYYLIPNKLARMYGGNVKYAVFGEDLSWVDPIAQYLQYVGLGPNATWVYTYRAPVTTTSFATQLAAADALGAHLIIDIFTLPLAPILISQVNGLGYKDLVVGIDVFGQLQTNWAATNGGCNYEVLLNWAGTATPIVPGLTDVFWNNFVGNYSEWPIYTAQGAYSAIYGLKDAILRAGSTDPNVLLPYIENTDMITVSGKLKYTQDQHDLYSASVGPVWPDGYSRSLAVQWTSSGTAGVMNVVTPIDQLYSRKTLIPTYMYSLATWDLNFDGKINIVDISTAAQAFGTKPGNSRWNFESDVDLSGDINIVDLAGIARHFGESAPTWPLP